jgi:hypothetical protein
VAKQVLLNSIVLLNATDLSSWLSKIELKAEVEDQDATTFASGGWNERLAGLRSWELGLTFKQDVAASQIDSIMWALFATIVSMETRLNSAVVGTSNPKYTGSLLVNGWTPINGSVGDIAEVDVTFPGSGALARATA